MRFLGDYADYCRTARHILLPIKANRFLAFQMCGLILLLLHACLLHYPVRAVLRYICSDESCVVLKSLRVKSPGTIVPTVQGGKKSMRSVVAMTP